MRGSAATHHLLGSTPRWSAVKMTVPLLRVDGSKWMTLQGGRRFLSTTTRGGRSSHAKSLFAVTTGTARPSAPSILHSSSSSLVCSVRCHQRRLVLSSSSCAAGRFASRTFAFQSRPYVATDGDAPKSEENAEATTDPLMQREEKIPKTAIVLGVAGLIPLVAASAVVLTQSPHLAAQAMILQLNYAANLLSFMGAIHWGLAMADYRDPLLLCSSLSSLFILAFVSSCKLTDKQSKRRHRATRGTCCGMA
ncbi:DUF3429 domain-containing protein (Fragment), variant 2 [Balamuthia mandrillaris]